MEIQKHPHHVTHKKKWGEYLLEFLMLFFGMPGSAIWSSPLLAHALRNVDANDLHVISVKIKNK